MLLHDTAASLSDGVWRGEMINVWECKRYKEVSRQVICNNQRYATSGTRIKNQRTKENEIKKNNV
jgi:hypothetical protein